MPVENASVWSKAQEIIREDLDNDQTYNIWFEPVNLISVSSDSIILEVPNKFFQGWLLPDPAPVHCPSALLRDPLIHSGLWPGVFSTPG